MTRHGTPPKRRKHAKIEAGPLTTGTAPSHFFQHIRDRVLENMRKSSSNFRDITHVAMYDSHPPEPAVEVSLMSKEGLEDSEAIRRYFAEMTRDPEAPGIRRFYSGGPGSIVPKADPDEPPSITIRWDEKGISAINEITC